MNPRTKRKLASLTSITLILAVGAALKFWFIPNGVVNRPTALVILFLTIATAKVMFFVFIELGEGP